jgi:hypothetical protein
VAGRNLDVGELREAQFPRSSAPLGNHAEVGLVHAPPHKVRVEEGGGKAQLSIRAFGSRSAVRIAALGLRLFTRRARDAAPECLVDIPVGHLQKFLEEAVKGGGGIGCGDFLFVQAKRRAIDFPLSGSTPSRRRLPRIGIRAAAENLERFGRFR